MARFKMSRIERAKQFAPFDALNGLGVALRAKEAELEYEERHELSDEELEEINAALCVLEEDDGVEVNYYCEGKYYEIIARVVKVDTVRKVLSVSVEDEHGSEIEVAIPFVDIRNIGRR